LIISIDAEKAFDKIQLHYMRKAFRKLGLEEMYLNIVKAIFTIAKLWKQPRCPTTDKWIKKMWYLYTMEFNSVTKNGILSFTSKWMKLEHIILSIVSQTQKTKNCMFSLMCGL
jgi:hypothetical protein